MTTTASFATPERIEQPVGAFHDDGFVHGPQLLSEQEVAQLPATGRSTMPASGYQPNGLRRDRRRLGKQQPHTQIRAASRLGAIAEHQPAMPLRVWDGEVVIKTPNDTWQTSLHDDQAGELLDSRITLKAWVALVDVPVEHGCLTFLPGSHRRGATERIEITEVDVEDSVREDARSYPRIASVTTVASRAGPNRFR
jgi:phytanoyl-CoA hydroxylase